MSSILSGAELVGGIAVGTGVGEAVGAAVAPLTQTLANETWGLHPDKPIAAGTAAQVAAQALETVAAMTTEASYTGYDAARFANLYGVALTGPGMGQLLIMLRRGTITADNFTHGLRKHQLEPLWDTALADLQHERIPAADLAYMVVRGLVPDAGLLPVAPPAAGVNVPRYPVWAGDTLAEAAAQGWDEPRFRALVGRAGLSMAPVMAANGYFRGILALDDFYMAIAEGDLRNEWRDAILNTSRQILTTGQYAELQLRGYYDEAARRANTAKHGMSDADSDLLYNVLGRSVNVHAVSTGLARGGNYPGLYANVPDPYKSAIERSNIREEYAELAYANRYNYPSAFVLRALTQGGEITEAQAHQILLDIGWEPTLAASVSASWAGGTAAGGDKHVTKAETSLFTTLHKSYVAEEATAADVTPGFAALAVPAASQTAVLALWDVERALIRKQLSPAQVKKAVKEAAPNPATGAPWTVADGLAALLARGYSQDDAATLLEE